MKVEAPTREARSTEQAPSRCARCAGGVEAGEHFCPECGAVQPPQVTDHFTFFGLPRKLDLDMTKLEKEFYRLSRKLHPDLYANATTQEQEWSLEKSSQLNDAYRALKDPIARTQYLLTLEGVQLEEQSKAATERARATGEEKKQVVPADLLEEVFELNMQLQELKASGGRDAEAREQLENARKTFEQRMERLKAELRGLWKEWDASLESGAAADSPERRSARDRMVDLLNRRSYVRNLLRDVKEAMGD